MRSGGLLFISLLRYTPPMRTLFLTDNYLPHHGGSRVYYHELLLQLHDQETCVLTRSQPGDTVFDTRQPYRIDRIPLEESPPLRPLRLQHFPIYRNLWKRGNALMHELNPDILIAGELVPTGPVVARLAAKYNKPFIVFTHAEGPSTLRFTRIQSRLSRWVCNRANRVIAASDNARDGLTKHFQTNPSKIDVILPAVGEAHFNESLIATPFAPGREHMKLLSVGRLIPRKNHIMVVRALAKLKAKHPNLHLSILGSGPTEQNIRAEIERLDIQENVEIVNQASPEALHDHFAKADCFVLPNIDDPITGNTEGFVIVFGEASAHGLPVIGGAAGGTAHSIIEGKTGYRVDGNSLEAVTATIQRLLDNPALAQTLGQGGRQYAQNSLRWTSRAAQFRRTLDIIKCKEQK